jgi:hypothetical protein
MKCSRSGLPIVQTVSFGCTSPNSSPLLDMLATVGDFETAGAYLDDRGLTFQSYFYMV